MKSWWRYGVLILFVLDPNLVWAWGRDGHEIIAKLAQTQLNDATVAALNDLRKQSINVSDLDTHETKPQYKYIDTNLPIFFNNTKLDLSLIANWPDGWRIPHPETYDWHFIDLEISKDVTKADEDLYCHQKGDNDCNAEQIPIQLKILGDTSQPALDRVKALFFVVHFVGDLHQPLHCADDNDKGGNDKMVSFFGQSTKLHTIWDDNIISQQGKSQQDIIKGFSISDAQAASWKRGDTGDWALESYQIAKNTIYPAYPSDGSTPSYETNYENQMWPVAQEQLEKAGVRLAYLLNSVFGGSTTSAGTATTVSTPTVSTGNTETSSSSQVVVIKKTAKIYSEPSAKSILVATVKKGDVFDLADPPKVKSYYHVTIDSQDGYIYSKNVTQNTPESSSLSGSKTAAAVKETISLGNTTGSQGACTGDIPCVATTDFDSQYRTEEKHRDPPTDVSAQPDSVADMLTWPAPSQYPNGHIPREAGTIDPREDGVYTVDGDIWLAKIEGNDCDIHIEMSAPGGSQSDDRVIVEIPKGQAFQCARNYIFEQIPNLKTKTPGSPVRLQQSIPIKVTGFAFYDGEHWSSNDPQRGHNHGSAAVGTIWEIHPVWTVSGK